MSLIEQLKHVVLLMLREGPDYIAWRLEAWVVRMKDIQEGTGIDVLHR